MCCRAQLTKQDIRALENWVLFLVLPPAHCVSLDNFGGASLPICRALGSLVPSPEPETLEQFALSQPISSTVDAELDLQRPSGFFLPLQNCLTSPEPAPQGSQQKA